jgi:hypothetical protein
LAGVVMRLPGWDAALEEVRGTCCGRRARRRGHCPVSRGGRRLPGRGPAPRPGPMRCAGLRPSVTSLDRRPTRCPSPACWSGPGSPTTARVGRRTR